MATSGERLKKALKTAAKLPAKAAIKAKTNVRGRAARWHRQALAPVSGETPIVILRLQVVSCAGLRPKDRNGAGLDPFVAVSFLSSKHTTPTSKRTLNPVFPIRESTFDFPLHLSVVERMGGVGAVELVVWDRDMLVKKEYVGEAAVIGVDGWFQGTSGPFSIPLESTRANTPSMGSVQIKLGFVSPPNTTNLMDFKEVHRELKNREAKCVKGRASWVSAPPTQGVGTIRSSQFTEGVIPPITAYQDDGGLSSAEDYDEESDAVSEGLSEADVDACEIPSYRDETAEEFPLVSSASSSPHASAAAKSATTKDARPKLAIQPESPTTPTLPVPPTAKAKAQTPGTATLPNFFTSSTPTSSGPTSPKSQSSLGNVATTPSMIVPVSAPPSPAPPLTPSKSATGKKRKGYQFEAGNDIVGIVMLEITCAEDLPRLKNVTRTGFDMDPFVVVSFGKKVFRTRIIRHSLNPVWNEKLLFHVRAYETSYKVQLTILDWDKLSSNDLIGDASFDVKSLVETAPQPDPTTGLYAPDYGGDHPMKEMKLDVILEKDISWEAQGAKPSITISAKYQSYAALRQRFWRQYLKQYDSDDTGTISHLELTSMLDSLGSTLTRSTIESFFERYGKKMDLDDLSIGEAIQCLESELGKPVSEKKRIDVSENETRSSSVSATPILSAMDKMGKELGDEFVNLEGLAFSGRPAHSTPQNPEHHQLLGSATLSGLFQQQQHQIIAPQQYTTEPNQMPPATDMEATPKKPSRFKRMRRKKKSTTNADASTAGTSAEMVPFERVINVKNCPLCHRPRLNSKAEMDIVTHLAVCASQDWNQVDRIMVGNFVTASQAQRKWYTNMWEKISAGDYRLGANSANIIVQNRITGQLEEEKMQVYVRLGIRLLYKGAAGRMESARTRRLLKSLSIKQGVKYDSPESVKEIPSFVQFHQLNVDEILDPLDSFKTFNHFFYRKLKPDARPVENRDDPYRLVSAADCRLMTFETVTEATKIWIKGRDFSVGRLLGDAYKDEVDKYTGGALGIFRLAPQDYHRFHSPVDGTIGRMTYISGEYYTVNPQAIRSSLDVYGENVRKIVPIDSPQFGRVMAVCVGAMMVGTIKTTVEEGQQVQRGQEFGYFAFGGSTIVVLFEKGALEWDEDLSINARASLETLVRVGMGIGNGKRRPVTS
ncbi:Phosphatidylserine decarboxylase domain containing protein [Amanita muscaria]